MKRLITILLGMPLLAAAQNKPLFAEGAAPNLYLSHAVAAKENLYSIGRMYNASPKDQIAPLNGFAVDKRLSLGQIVKIPLAGNNFVQDNSAAADEVLVPVYHTVQEKEGLYRISVNHNKVPIETLKKWNNITGDAVSNGTQLIVGYLKVKKDLSPLAAMATQAPPVAITPPAKPKPEPKPVVTTPKKEPTKPDIFDGPLPPVKNPEKENPPVVEPPKPKPVVKKDEPIAPVEVKGTGLNFNGGAFKNGYSDNDNSAKENGAANVFKSNSGWSDGKYYCLHNSAAPGTIIKVTSNSTGKSVYAKVLDIIPDIKQNNGLLIRISNAAAEELGVGENKFDCTLQYNK